MADRVTVIGWDGSPLTDAARSALAAATLVAGAAHHLALSEVPPRAERIRLGSTSLAARRIARHRGTAVVLADGDPGFFGVVRTLRAPEHGLEVEVVPAVSSVAAAFARAGMPWDDAQLVVATSRTLRRAVNVCRAHNKVAVLTSPGAGPAELALLLNGVHRTFVICEALGTEREQVTVLTSDKVADHTWRDPNVVIVVGGSGAGADSGTTQGTGWLAGHEVGYPPAIRGWALPTAEYAGEPAEGSGGGPGGRVGAVARRPTGLAGAPHGGPRLGHRRGQRRVRRGGRAVRGRGHRRRRATPTPAVAATRPRGGSASSWRSCTASRRTSWRTCPSPTWCGSAPGARPPSPPSRTAAPARIVTHATTRDEAEAAGRALGERGYAVECALLQSVRLETAGWTETERSVVFLLSAIRN